MCLNRLDNSHQEAAQGFGKMQTRSSEPPRIAREIERTVVPVIPQPCPSCLGRRVPSNIDHGIIRARLERPTLELHAEKEGKESKSDDAKSHVTAIYYIYIRYDARR